MEVQMRKSPLIIIAAVASLALAGQSPAQETATPATAEVQPINRIPLQRFEVPDTAYETIIGIAEIAPNVNVGLHTHPGPESGYAIEGSFELLVEGEAPRMIREGESYMVPANVAHDAKTGPDGAKVIATYLIPGGQPVSSPVE
jgi:quercetin dioxygenase-like cupin family protein